MKAYREQLSDEEIRQRGAELGVHLWVPADPEAKIKTVHAGTWPVGEGAVYAVRGARDADQARLLLAMAHQAAAMTDEDLGDLAETDPRHSGELTAALRRVKKLTALSPPKPKEKAEEVVAP